MEPLFFSCDAVCACTCVCGGVGLEAEVHRCVFAHASGGVITEVVTASSGDGRSQGGTLCCQAC